MYIYTYLYTPIYVCTYIWFQIYIYAYISIYIYNIHTPIYVYISTYTYNTHAPRANIALFSRQPYVNYIFNIVPSRQIIAYRVKCKIHSLHRVV